MLVKAKDRWIHPGPQPNGLQADKDCLWAIDQTDNHLYKLSYKDGSILEKINTETVHPSGITVGGGYIWGASTYSCELFKLNSKGETVDVYDTPGKGVVAYANSEDQPETGAHGMEWVDEDNMWIAVPPAQKVFLVDPSNMSVKRSIPTPGIRPHGLFLYGDFMWLADTQAGKIHKLNPNDGTVLDEIEISEPEIHGMTLKDNNIWFCCSESRRVCTVPLPV